MPATINKIKKDLVIFCPLCNKEYYPRDLRTVESAGPAVLVHSHCPVCNISVLSLMYKDILGITLVGMATDLNYDDVLKFKDSQPVSYDNLLDIYDYFS